MCNVNFDWSQVPAYEWNGKNEAETVEYFRKLSEQLDSALGADENHRFEVVGNAITAILDWGNISLGENGINQFIEEIQNVNRNYADIQPEDNNFERNVREILRRGRNGNDWRISSWSKILAAWKPGTFFIYDSRVAIGLSIVKPDVTWAIPSARGKNSMFGFVSTAIERNHAMNLPDSYCSYLKFLHQFATCNKIDFSGYLDLQSKMAHIEKLLFMIPEMLIYNVQLFLKDQKLPEFSCNIRPGRNQE